MTREHIIKMIMDAVELALLKKANGKDDKQVKAEIEEIFRRTEIKF